MLNLDYIEAHKKSQNHRDELKNDKVCGCFYCLRIFSPDEIDEWVEDISGTAVCPYCGIDSVIGENSGFTITYSFLENMKKYWFDGLGADVIDS